MNFASDNTAGASPRVMEALARASAGASPAYGADDWSARAARLLGELFEHEVAVSLTATGTGANALALACLVQPWGAVLTHKESHIVGDECGAPEFFTHGAKIVGLPGMGAKLTPETVTRQLALMPGAATHVTPPQCLSITQATECGLVYAPAEIAALCAVAREAGLSTHMDGARFANAVARLGCAPADVTWRAGVDALTFGFTKNGAWAAEAIILFDPAKADELARRRKRGGHTLSKGRLIGAQVEALLTDGHWLDLARAANARADELAEVMRALPGVRLAWPVEANEVFAVMPEAFADRLAAAGVELRRWSGRALAPADVPARGEGVYRFVCSFATGADDIARFTAAARAVA